MFNDPPIEIFITAMKKWCVSSKENDIKTLIVEGGWASDDNNSSFGERLHANSGTIFYHDDSPEILK